MSLFLLQWHPGLKEFEPTDTTPMSIGKHFVATYDYPLWGEINPLHAKFSTGNINIYLHFMSLLHIDMTQVVEILHQVRPGPTYST